MTKAKTDPQPTGDDDIITPGPTLEDRVAHLEACAAAAGWRLPPWHTEPDAETKEPSA